MKMPPDKEQQGGKFLGEGADGCIFEAPGNWPCEKPLKGYNLSDKSLVSKIVPTSDIEGDILEIVESIAKRHPEHYNLIHYVGKCKPKVSGFTKTIKNSYKKHLNQMAKTEKACKTFKNDLKDGTIQSNDYKMYVIGKYEKTYKQFCQDLEFQFYSKDHIADIIYKAQFAFVDTLKNLISDPVYTVINFDLHSKNIVVFNKPFKSLTDKKDKFEIGVADFGRAIWCKKSEPYTFKTYLHWDKPFIEAFLIRDPKETAGETFSIYNQFSLEARLLNYILTNINRKHKKDTLWIERMYDSIYIKKALKDPTIYDTLLFYLPTLIKSIKNSKTYKKYENGIEMCVEALGDTAKKGPDTQYSILKSNSNLRKFWDLLKSRSHLPSALGVYLMRGLRAANYNRKQIIEIIENPQQTKIYVPEKFRLLIFKYINYLMMPFT